MPTITPPSLTSQGVSKLISDPLWGFVETCFAQALSYPQKQLPVDPDFLLK
jgi:hypothetical protein